MRAESKWALVWGLMRGASAQACHQALRGTGSPSQVRAELGERPMFTAKPGIEESESTATRSGAKRTSYYGTLQAALQIDFAEHVGSKQIRNKCLIADNDIWRGLTDALTARPTRPNGTETSNAPRSSELHRGASDKNK